MRRPTAQTVGPCRPSVYQQIIDITLDLVSDNVTHSAHRARLATSKSILKSLVHLPSDFGPMRNIAQPESPTMSATIASHTLFTPKRFASIDESEPLATQRRS